MITIKDKSDDNWCALGFDDNSHVYCEDGTKEPFTTSHVLFTRGKYEGELLSNVSDVWYLNFMQKQGVDNEDWFMQECAKMRLLEIK